MKNWSIGNTEPANYPRSQLTGSKGFGSAATYLSRTHPGDDVTGDAIDSSSSVITSPQFKPYNYFNENDSTIESRNSLILREDNRMPMVPQSYDESFGLENIHTEQGPKYSQTPEESVTPPVEEVTINPNAGLYEESVDPSHYPYWYSSNTAVSPYSSVPYNHDLYTKPMATYSRYSYSPLMPYYHGSKAIFNNNPNERKLPYHGAYHMQEAFYQGKAPYPLLSPTRRPQTWVNVAPHGDISPTTYYNTTPDSVSYKGWTAKLGDIREATPPSGLTVPMLAHDYRQELVPIHRDQQYEAESFYNELSARLQNELKKKSPLGTAGRPKMNRNNYVCANCNAKSTPQWRYIKGTSVCNACYMRVRKQKMKRMKKEEAGYDNTTTEAGLLESKAARDSTQSYSQDTSER